MEQRNIIALAIGVILGVIVGWMGMLFYIGYTWARGYSPPHFRVDEVRLQRIEIDGYTPPLDSILYLLEAKTTDTTATTPTDRRCLKKIIVESEKKKEISQEFTILKRINNREFSSATIECPLLYKSADVETGYISTLKEIDLSTICDYTLLLLPKDAPLPERIELEFDNCVLKGEVNNIPVKYYIMEIEYD